MYHSAIIVLLPLYNALSWKCFDKDTNDKGIFCVGMNDINNDQNSVKAVYW